MPPFDRLIDAAARDQGLGDAAGPLVRETASLIAGTPGGLAGFLDRFRRGGLGAVVETWLGRTDANPLDHEQVEHILGAVTVSGIAGRVGIGREAAGTALGNLIPRLCGLLSPDGIAVAAVPPALTAFLGGEAVAAPAGHAAGAHGTPSEPAGHAAPAPDSGGNMAGGWAAAMVACVVGIAVVAWLMQPPAPRPAPTPARVEAPAAPAAKADAPAPSRAT